MVPFRLRDHRRGQRLGVVGAHQPEAVGAREGEVQQRLVPLALDELVRVPGREDRLADPAQPHAGLGVLVDELLPGGDDSRRVPADHVHVRELHAVGVRPERRTELLELVCERDDQASARPPRGPL